jgi:mono/diheme cytochrome c family protein
MNPSHALVGLVATVMMAAAPAGTHAAPAIAAIAPPARSAFDADVIRRGAALAAIGNCNVCHTAPNGRPYAGGYPVKTPFGTIYGTNITPDAETGIGRWSEAAFRRAMREGLDREGRHLYPAFPYDHFTRMTDEDIGAIYAFVMTREPVRAATPPNALAFPFNIRAMIAVWKGLFLERGVFQPDPRQSADWNRGAYLSHGLGHCGACHTPRNALGAEKKNELFAGGDAEGWHAPALDARSPSPVPWTLERLFRYLRTGLVEPHAVPAGPMAPVVRNLAGVPEQDVRAIATYVMSVIGAPTAERQRQARVAIEQAQSRQASFAAANTGSMKAPAAGIADGKAIYAGACGICHDSGRTVSSGGALPLGLSIAAAIPSPRNLMYIIQYGIVPPEGEPGRYMPPFDGALTAEQMTALLAYIRSDLANAPAWPNLQDEVEKAMREGPQR